MVAGGTPSGIPQAPSYINPAPYNNPQYTPAGAYQSPGAYTNPGAAISGPTSDNYQSQTAGQVMNAANAASAQLPGNLQLSASNMATPDAVNSYANSYYNDYVKPGLAQTQAGLYGNGRADSTFGGAVLGSALAQGAQDKMMAGQQYYTNQLNNLLNERASFFNGEGNMAQTAANQGQQNAQFSANLGMQNAGMLNNYNLSNSQGQNQFNLASSQGANNFNLANAGMANQFNLSNSANRNNYAMTGASNANQFNLGNFNNQMNSYQLGQQQQQNKANGYGQVLAGGLAAAKYITGP